MKIDLDSIINIVNAIADTTGNVNSLYSNFKLTNNSKEEIKINEPTLELFDEQLEKLIEMSLLDGIITEKEKEILFQKAESLGIDFGEFELILEARLYEQNKLLNESALKKLLRQLQEAKDSEKEKLEFRIIQLLKPKTKTNKTAKKIGAAFNSFLDGSTAGGSVVVTKATNLFFDKLLDDRDKVKIEEWGNETENKINELHKDIISSFSIPEKKEEILEFIEYAWHKANKLSIDSNKKVWENKFIEIINNSKRKYNNDSIFHSEIHKIEAKYLLELKENKQKEQAKRKIIIGLIAILISIIGVLIPTLIIPYSQKESEKSGQEEIRLEEIFQNANTAIKSQNIIEAEILADQLVWNYKGSWSSYEDEKKIWEKKKTELSKVIDKMKKDKEQSRLEQVRLQINNAIKNKNITEAEILLSQLTWKEESLFDNYKNEKKIWGKENTELSKIISKIKNEGKENKGIWEKVKDIF